MKCLLNKKVTNTLYNTKDTGKILYKRKENEGTIEMLDDFSINKTPLVDSKTNKS